MERQYFHKPAISKQKSALFYVLVKTLSNIVLRNRNTHITGIFIKGWGELHIQSFEIQIRLDSVSKSYYV